MWIELHVHLMICACEHTLCFLLRMMITFGGSPLSRKVLHGDGVDECLHGMRGAL